MPTIAPLVPDIEYSETAFRDVDSEPRISSSGEEGLFDADRITVLNRQKYKTVKAIHLPRSKAENYKDHRLVEVDFYELLEDDPDSYEGYLTRMLFTEEFIGQYQRFRF